MEILKFVAIAIAAALPFASAYAASTDCSTADQTLSFHSDGSDGGAGRAPNIQLRLNGQILVDLSYTGNPHTRLASYDFTAPEHVISTKRVGDPGRAEEAYEITQSVTTMTVMQGEKTLFSDYVFCKTSVYVGPPLP